jgi:hydroxyacylglutathione hydrolase
VLIHSISAFQDNYIWALVNPDKRNAVIIDPGDAAPVLKFLNQHDLNLSAILITHHHYDHTNGITELIKHFTVPVFGPNENIAGLTQPVKEGDCILDFKILDIPGHTHHHIAYYANNILFCGDTLFTGGCGKIFEGTKEQMYSSLMKLAALPDETKIYCGHEYTLSNLQFAEKLEPNNLQIKARLAKVKTLRKNNQPSVPSLLSDEKETNPFLRCHSPELIHYIEQYTNRQLIKPIDVFAAIREYKNNF